ncbi:MAG: hypothetical protein EBU46_18375 [Nitrosomonadaceae bacterium]|nr:hypothetical protein [Nitrosomonadaceae bacterium]
MLSTAIIFACAAAFTAARADSGAQRKAAASPPPPGGPAQYVFVALPAQSPSPAPGSHTTLPSALGVAPQSPPSPLGLGAQYMLAGLRAQSALRLHVTAAAPQRPLPSACRLQ